MLQGILGDGLSLAVLPKHIEQGILDTNAGKQQYKVATCV
jgi:hypothetical protein